MSDSTLYDDDILLWSEQQAAAIRRLRETARGLPNELDIENVAEEIESVGRSELAAVESYVELTLFHLIKLAVEPGSDAALHWRAEIAGFSFNLSRRFTESMRRRIGLERAWRSARRQATLLYGDRATDFVANLPAACPISIDDLLEEDMDVVALVERLKGDG
jgi:hypothetical protein